MKNTSATVWDASEFDWNCIWARVCWVAELKWRLEKRLYCRSRNVYTVFANLGNPKVEVRYHCIFDECGWPSTASGCIDKRSSAELSEAINSMFKWYSKSRVCYAYLADAHAKPKTHVIGELDFEKAARYYRSAADTQMSALAMWNLGWMYENGVGVPQVIQSE